MDDSLASERFIHQPVRHISENTESVGVNFSKHPASFLLPGLLIRLVIVTGRIVIISTQTGSGEGVHEVRIILAEEILSCVQKHFQVL